MPRKPPLTDEEKAIFREAMRGVTPLADKKIAAKSAPPRTVQRQIKAPKAVGFEFSDHETLLSVSSKDLLHFSRAGIQDKMLRKMRQGQYNVNASLDLHGRTVVEAREALSDFLLQCQQNDWRHVLIIHGKGLDNNKPILKNKINHWLRQTEQVLAFCSAVPRDGASGAVYVLLKKNR